MHTSSAPPVVTAFDPFSPAQVADPHALYAELRRDTPVFISPALGGMWVVTRHDDVVAVLGDPATFSSNDAAHVGLERLTPEALGVLAEGYPIPPQPLTSDPPLHTALRRSLARGFTPRRIAALAPRVREIAAECIDRFPRDGRVDLMPALARPLPIRVIFELVGVPVAHIEEVTRWCDDWFHLLFAPVTPEEQPALARSYVAYQRYVAALIAERRAHPREDLISDILAAEADGESLSDGDLVHTIANSLVAAGHETTTAAVATMMRTLLRDRSRWEALLADRGLVPAAVEEALRWDGVALGFTRTARRDARVGGHDVPAGTRVFCLYACANRDPARFSEPDRFDLHRQSATGHLTFGRGVHHCLGAALARTELGIVLEQLLARLPSLRLEQADDLGYYPHIAIRGFHRLPVAWDP